MLKVLSDAVKVLIVGAFASALVVGGAQVVDAQSGGEECDTEPGTCVWPVDDDACDWYCRTFLDHEYGGTCDGIFGCCLCID